MAAVLGVRLADIKQLDLGRVPSDMRAGWGNVSVRKYKSVPCWLPLEVVDKKLSAPLDLKVIETQAQSLARLLQLGGAT